MVKRRSVSLALLLLLFPATLVAQETPTPPPKIAPMEGLAPNEGEDAVTVEVEESGEEGGLSEQAISQITHEVSNEVLSPFCPGKTLAMCPSPAAAEARRTIQELAKKGLTKDQIVDELVDQYGSEFKRVTPGLDDNLVVLILVIVGLLFCSIFVWFLSFRGKRKESPNDTDILDESEEHHDNQVVGGTSEEVDDYLSSLRDEYKS